MAGLFAVAACKFVHSRCRTITSTMANFLAIDTLHLDSIRIFDSFLGAGTSGMSEF